jgi:hypothetical protein
MIISFGDIEGRHHFSVFFHHGGHKLVKKACQPGPEQLEHFPTVSHGDALIFQP